jgi:hypothetical protein
VLTYNIKGNEGKTSKVWNKGLNMETNINQPPSSVDSVDDYKAKVLTQTLVSDLKRLRDFSQKLNFEQSVKQMNTVLQRIEAKQFSVAVVGEFKRGKSTFNQCLTGASDFAG